MKNSSTTNALILCIFFMIAGNFSYSATPIVSIVPKAGTSLPTQVFSGATVSAYYTVTNNTSRTFPSMQVYSLPPNVTQVTSNGTYANLCATTFALLARASCTLELKITGPVEPPNGRIIVCASHQLSCSQTVHPLNVKLVADPSVDLKSITVTPKTATARIGAKPQFTALGIYPTGSRNIDDWLTWKSSNALVATISAQGVATGIEKGTTLITASLGSVTSAGAKLSIVKPTPVDPWENTPTISSISPSSGSTAGGTSVTITGTHFTGATDVDFGATQASGFSVVSDTQMTATSPPGSAGVVDITVTTAEGTSATSSADEFTYVTPPATLTSITVNVSAGNMVDRGPLTYSAAPGSIEWLGSDGNQYKAYEMVTSPSLGEDLDDATYLNGTNFNLAGTTMETAAWGDDGYFGFICDAAATTYNTAECTNVLTIVP